MTVNVAIPLTVRLRIDLDAPQGEVLHAVDGADTRSLFLVDAATDLSAAVAFFLVPAGGVRITVHSQASIGSGLGGSSAYAVALARALLASTGRELSNRRLVAVLRDLEARVLRAPTGVQDHWSAITGGVSAIHIEPGGERVERLDVDPAWIGDRMTIFHSGISHHSGMVNWQVIRRRLEGAAPTKEALDGIARAAGDCRKGLMARDAAGVGRAIAKEWTHRKRLAPEVCPPEILEIERRATAAGATAFKVCGAGGGGSVLVWYEPEDRAVVEAALKEAAPNGRVVATTIAARGCRVEKRRDS